MQSIIIDKGLQELLPPLGKETYKNLEENIIANGCMFPLVTWRNILIDGHNRYAICTQHDIPYETVEKEFDTHEEVIEWIFENHLDRRSFTPMQLNYYKGLRHKNRRSQEKGKNPEAVWAITGSLYKLLLEAAYKGTAAQTKKALKEYIGILDELYAQM